MMVPTINGFQFDDQNEEKLWNHGIDIGVANQVLEYPFKVVRNRKERRAQFLIIGTDRQGRCIALPIESTHDPWIWRPITGWFCKKSEWALCP